MPFTHQLCIAHGLHLAVQDFLYKTASVVSESAFIERDDFQDQYNDEEDDSPFIIFGDDDAAQEITDEIKLQGVNLKEVVAKIRKGVMAFKSSPVKTDDVLSRWLPKDKNNKTYSLIMDVKTRWSSTQKMMERFMLVHTGLEVALIKENVDVRFNATEITLIRDVSKVLGTVSFTLEKLCSRTATLVNVDSRITALLYDLNEGSAISKELARRIATRINERRTVASSAIQLTMNGGRNVLSQQIKKHTKKEIRTYLKEVWERIKPKENESPSGEVNVTLPVSSETEHDSFEKKSNALDKAQSVSVSQKVHKDLDSEIDDLENFLVRGPKIIQIFEWLSTIQATSVEAERNFSVSGRACNKINSRLGDDSIFALSFLYSLFRAAEDKEKKKKK